MRIYLALLLLMFPSLLLAGDDCVIEYETNASVCVEIKGRDLDCTSYNCNVNLSYIVETDYKGGSSLYVEVECTVKIKYEGRNTFFAPFYVTESDSKSESESHALYANGRVSETMNFNFSLSYYDEVIRVWISSAECEIEGVGLQ